MMFWDAGLPILAPEQLLACNLVMMFVSDLTPAALRLAPPLHLCEAPEGLERGLGGEVLSDRNQTSIMAGFELFLPSLPMVFP
jgi:hypothetical protein